MTRSLGLEIAEIAATNHEYGQLGTKWDANARMDLANNAIGRDMASLITEDDILDFGYSDQYRQMSEQYNITWGSSYDAYVAYLTLMALDSGRLTVLE